MQVLLLGLFVLLYLHDASTYVLVVGEGGSARAVEALPADAWPYLGPLQAAPLVLGPKLLIALAYHLACGITRRRLGTPSGHRSLKRLDKLTAALPLLLLALFVVDLGAGGLRGIRVLLRHTVLLDEAVIIMPTLAVVVLAWWSYYPIDRRLREAAVFRLADAGRPVYPLQTRGGYLAMQARHQLGLLMLPLLAVFAWSESITLLGPDHRGLLGENAALGLTPLGVLGVFVLSPLVIRYVWHTRPLPAGEVRDRMLAMCKAHRVAVRELLLWQTGGGLVNAAVTGLVRRVRYILLSDGLLDQVPPRAVEAVMAHELAHVKCRHMIWMGLVLLTALGLIEQAGYGVMAELILPALGNVRLAALHAKTGLDLSNPQTQAILVAAPAFALTLLAFGWVSRRIERQADVFAARHLAQTADDKRFDARARQLFDEASVQAMIDALQRVAVLNQAPVERRSWRHGSIAWRQDHLRSLVGTPLDDAQVDRVMARVKLATLAGLAALIAGFLF